MSSCHSCAEAKYDAALLLSYGAPETLDDVERFLRRVLHQHALDDATIRELRRPYSELDRVFGIPSPLPNACRRLMAAWEDAIKIPVYSGHLFYEPFIADTLGIMATDGVTRAIAITTSPFGGSPHERYKQSLKNDLVNLVPPYYSHPLFIAGIVESIRREITLATTTIIFTTHSLPLSDHTATQYQEQINTAAAAAMREFSGLSHTVVFQSQSRLAQTEWLQPDICDFFANTTAKNAAVIVPIGFLCENKETVYDLDVVAMTVAEEHGWSVTRATTFAATSYAVQLLVALDVPYTSRTV